MPKPTDTDLGRETLYEPVVVCSPILASQRIYQAKKTHRLITEEEVDELSAKLNMMLLSAKTTQTEEEETKESSNDDEAHETAKGTHVPLKEKPKVGRFDDTVFSKKAKGEVPVKRCTRLAGGKM